MTPFTPSLYRPGSDGRYRAYPRVVETPIPGAGYEVGQLAWAEQELNLGGARQNYGNYSSVPLRGLGAMTAAQMMSTSLGPVVLETPAPTSRGVSTEAPAESRPENWGSDADYGFEAADMVSEAARAAEMAAASLVPAPAEEESFLSQKLGPVPYWALGVGLLVVAGGGGYYLYSRRVRPNRRRTSRRAR
jgi:hypothetical protein